MSCDGCRKHVQKILGNVAGVTSVEVDLKKKQATIESDTHIDLSTFQKAFKDEGVHYEIMNLNEAVPEKKKKKLPHKKGIYY